MIYDNDQCVHCGGVRVVRTDMCADCLLRTYDRALVEIARLGKEKLVLHDKLQQALRLGERLLDHISSEAVYTSELRLELWKAKEIIKGGDWDEENRQAKDFKAWKRRL